MNQNLDADSASLARAGAPAAAAVVGVRTQHTSSKVDNIVVIIFSAVRPVAAHVTFVDVLS